MSFCEMYVRSTGSKTRIWSNVALLPSIPSALVFTKIKVESKSSKSRHNEKL